MLPQEIPTPNADSYKNIDQSSIEASQKISFLKASTGSGEKLNNLTSSVASAINNIETSAQSCSLILVQKQINMRKWKNLKPNAHAEKLHEISKKRAIARISVAEDLKKKLALVSYSYHPEINDKSKLLVKKMDGEVLERTHEWNAKKLEKTQDRLQKKEENEKKILLETTQFFNFMNKNTQKESKVRSFVEALNYFKGQKEQQKSNYRNKTPDASKNVVQNANEERINSKSQNILKKPIKHVVNSNFVETQRIVKQDQSKSPLKTNQELKSINLDQIKKDLHMRLQC